MEVLNTSLLYLVTKFNPCIFMFRVSQGKLGLGNDPKSVLVIW